MYVDTILVVTTYVCTIPAVNSQYYRKVLLVNEIRKQKSVIFGNGFCACRDQTEKVSY